MIMGMGFNISDNEKEVSSYEKHHLNEPGHYAVGQISATGILKEINFREGYLMIQPSIVGYGNSARLETESPTIIRMEQGQPISMRPLKEGDLCKIVKDANEKIRK